MLYTPIYNPEKTIEQNFYEGPWGDFADKKIYENNGEPAYTVFHKKVFLPFGIPACPVGMNSRFIQSAFMKGFDIVTYKTVRSTSHPAHQFPNILAVHPGEKLTIEQAKQGIIADHQFREPLSIANSFGVNSSDPDIWQPEMAKALTTTGKGQLLIGSCQGTLKEGMRAEDYIADFALAARLVKETGIPVIELNLSCPNEGKAALLCFDVERVERIIEKVKNEIGDTPLIIKLAYFQNKQLLETLVEKTGKAIQGIAAINTIQTKLINHQGNQAFPGEGRLFSGVSGAAIRWAGLEMTQHLKKYRGQYNMDYTIIGIGGVIHAENYNMYKKAGADIVMSAAGAMWNPYLAQEIKKQ